MSVSNCLLQTAEQDRHLTQTNMKIDTEVAGLKTMLESHKLDTIKYLAGRAWHKCIVVMLLANECIAMRKKYFILVRSETNEQSIIHM